MGYTTLNNPIKSISEPTSSFVDAALAFIRENCEKLRFDEKKTKEENSGKQYLGTSLKAGQIPYNMQMDIDRLCLENALARFLRSGKKEDAFDVYFCYLEMFVGNYGDTRRMIELLSEFEANGSSLLMKHRDHYSHSVYVFALGLAIFNTNSSPYMKFKHLDRLVKINDNASQQLFELFKDEFDDKWKGFADTNELFAYEICKKLGEKYHFDKNAIEVILKTKPTNPDCFNYFMEHAYFSANLLFKELAAIEDYRFEKSTLDALTAIILHNSLYKFSIAYYKSKQLNKPFEADSHPLAYLLMLCDELQCWNRTSYGRNSKKELHPMGCKFTFSDNSINAVYTFDEKEKRKTDNFEEVHKKWKAEHSKGDKNEPKLKAYSEMWVENDGDESAFLKDIKKIVDLTGINFSTKIEFGENSYSGGRNYLSNSNFLSLYNFAVVLNGRWNNSEWEAACAKGREEEYLSDEKVIKNFTDSFGRLSLEYKMSNINHAKAFAEYMYHIGCFYTDKQVDFKMVDQFTEKELGIIGSLEHKRWLQEHYDMGWIYGEPENSERDLLRQHKDMIPEFKGFEVTDGQSK